MEMQFDRLPVPYLKKLTHGIRTQEETLEVRLPEGMPDIGRVLGAWGQVIVRGKEWNGSNMTLSCGVMAWALYTPEDGEDVRSIEAWLPFTMQWDLPETRYDGKILSYCALKSIDARSTSARKLMVRAVLQADADAYQVEQAQLAVPGELPADVQLLTAQYPMLLPREAGEKAFALEEQLSISDMPKPKKLLYYALQPELTDKKVMAGKVVFRGSAMLHVLYRCEDEQLYSWDYELPFSQYADLDDEYSQEAELDVTACVTALDISLDEAGQLQLKAGLLGQYLLSERTMLSVTEDAYSPNRRLELQFEQLDLPAVLDSLNTSLQPEVCFQAEAQRVVDAVFLPGCGQLTCRDSECKAMLSGLFQMLYYDLEGNLRSAAAACEAYWIIPGDTGNEAVVRITAAGKPQASVGGNAVVLRTDMSAEACISAGQGIRMLTALELGEAEKPDPNRPSLILCRKGSRKLWDISKETGSTVEAILQANNLTEEPEEGQILLIPVK